jgi:hypothetical protein
LLHRCNTAPAVHPAAAGTTTRLAANQPLLLLLLLESEAVDQPPHVSSHDGHILIKQQRLQLPLQPHLQ